MIHGKTAIERQLCGEITTPEEPFKTQVQSGTGLYKAILVVCASGILLAGYLYLLSVTG